MKSQTTPCSDPPCGSDKEYPLCDTHGVEHDHARGSHEYCGVTCEAEFPSESLRNAILYRAIPGSGNMLKELLRRAAVPHAAQDAQVRDSFTFLVRVLELFSMSHADIYGDLFWRVDDGTVRMFANVSDVFLWGGSDVEEITPATLPVLEQAYKDLKAVGAEEFMSELYAARQRHVRPQGAAYPTDAHEAWRRVSELYNECGPARKTDLGNPQEVPWEGVPNP